MSYSREDLQKVLQFNYGLNKLGLHPFLGVNDPVVRRRMRATGQMASAKAKELIDTEHSLLTTRSRAESMQCAICTDPCSDNDQVTKHKACNLIAHTDCLEVWLGHSSQCPECRVNFVKGNDSEQIRAFRLANEQLQNNIETGYNPAALLQTMVDRVDRMTGYMSTNELFALHTAAMELNDDHVPQNQTDLDDEMDFGEYSCGGDFDWED